MENLLGEENKRLVGGHGHGGLRARADAAEPGAGSRTPPRKLVALYKETAAQGEESVDPVLRDAVVQGLDGCAEAYTLNTYQTVVHASWQAW